MTMQINDMLRLDPKYYSRIPGFTLREAFPIVHVDGVVEDGYLASKSSHQEIVRVIEVCGNGREFYWLDAYRKLDAARNVKESLCTACDRGYVAEYGITHGVLILSHLYFDAPVGLGPNPKKANGHTFNYRYDAKDGGGPLSVLFTGKVLVADDESPSCNGAELTFWRGLLMAVSTQVVHVPCHPFEVF